MSTNFGDVRPLHLHSIESLIHQLIGGGSVGVGEKGETFSLGSPASRSVLGWYQTNRPKWSGNLSLGDVEAIVDRVDMPLPVTVLSGSLDQSTKRFLTLKRMRAHRFAGIHQFGTTSEAPEDFEYCVTPGVTLFEGFNGAGKTSLLNAVVWCLTGMLLRPQRAPEEGAQEFEFDLLHEGADEATSYRLSCVTPMPLASMGKLKDVYVPADTWVELTFADADGAELTPLRRSVNRTSRGKLEESVPAFDALGLDTTMLRIGTVIPALLPFSQPGTQSELGRAVAQLTGLAPLADLAKHAGKAAVRISGELTKARKREIELHDESFARGLDDLVGIAAENPGLAIDTAVPLPQEERRTESFLESLKEALAISRASGLQAAREVLGDGFKPEDHAQGFEGDVSSARATLDAVASFASAQRLSALSMLTDEEKTDARSLIESTLRDAEALVNLSRMPQVASRQRLYAAVAQWCEEHSIQDREFETCAVCGASLEGVLDSETGQSIRQHLREARESDAGLVAQTIERWATSVSAHLAAALPDALAYELRHDLSEEPFDLLEASVMDEMLAAPAFQRSLRPLIPLVRQACESLRADAPKLVGSQLPNIEERLGAIPMVRQAVERLDRALRIADWGREQKPFLQRFTREILGQQIENTPAIQASLLGRLNELERIILTVAPIDAALKACSRMDADIESRRRVEQRLDAYRAARTALEECCQLGGLAELQVAELQQKLHSATEAWRKEIYQAGYPNAHHDLTETTMKANGQVEFRIGIAGTSAPAQHVANASALRATLIAFYFAYWEYLRAERGGLALIVLDDPQELLDGDNKERLARAVAALGARSAQPIVTTHDGRFARHVVVECHAASLPIEHREVHPPTRKRPTLATSPSVLGVDKALKLAKDSEWTFKDHAQDYAGRCREFIEARLGDFFEDAGYVSTTAYKMKPTLADHVNDLKGAVARKSTPLFEAKNVVALATDKTLDPKSLVMGLLNKAHHATRPTILPGEVEATHVELERLRGLVEGAHQDFRTYCKREFLEPSSVNLDPLPIEQVGEFALPIQPNLAAFVHGEAYGASQEAEVDMLSSDWFADKAAFFLRTSNFGFASTVGGVAIVEASPSEAPDRSLVIGRRGENTFARRLHRTKASSFVALATETPDPRFGRPTLIFRASEIAIHKVVGMLFHTEMKSQQAGKGEAEQVDLGTILKSIRRAYRVKAESAVPLALDGQIALGGDSLDLSGLDRFEGYYVAVHLSDETTLFKRVGKRLPGELGYLRQFETIGGLGTSDVLAVGLRHQGIATVESAVLILGILYNT